MEITVNAEQREVESTSVAAVLAELGFGSPSIATAVNGSFVPRGEREMTELSQGDRLEVLSPMKGG